VISGVEPITYLVTRGEAVPATFHLQLSSIIETVREAVSDGIDLIQIREKQLTGKQLFELSVAAAGQTRGTKTKLLVNDRLDIALAAGADGVHLAENSILPSVVRTSVPPSFLIAASVHSLEGLRQASSGADLCVYGPVFDTPGKTSQGIAALRHICSEAAPYPVIAIGGVDETNFQSVLAAGAAGFAAIRALNDTRSRRKIIAELRSMGVTR
jgi:thiamine-phosphate pyrophosphorylase